MYMYDYFQKLAQENYYKDYSLVTYWQIWHWLQSKQDS